MPSDEYTSHTVADGEDLLSIAALYKTSADKIWNDPKNKQTRDAKAEDWRRELGDIAENPYVLEPGDTIWIPPFRPKKVSISTDKRHTFRRKGLTTKLVLFLKRDEKPRVGLKYKLDVKSEEEGDQHFEGATDGTGKIEHVIPVDAVRGRLEVEPEPHVPEQGEGKGPFDDEAPAAEVYDLFLGHLDPVTTDRGLRSRLHNLGFLADMQGDEAQLTAALNAFQEYCKIRVTGTPTQKTLRKLVELHLS